MISKTSESLIWVHVTLHAPKDAVDGWQDGKLHVRLRAIAEKGRANKALLELLSEHFSVAKTQIEIVSGRQCRNKRIRLPIKVKEI